MKPPLRNAIVLALICDTIGCIPLVVGMMVLGDLVEVEAGDVAGVMNQDRAPAAAFVTFRGMPRQGSAERLSGDTMLFRFDGDPRLIAHGETMPGPGGQTAPSFTGRVYNYRDYAGLGHAELPGLAIEQYVQGPAGLGLGDGVRVVNLLETVEDVRGPTITSMVVVGGFFFGLSALTIVGGVRMVRSR